jgi:hypothetical protein
LAASTTDKIRIWLLVLFTISVLVTLAGWLFDKDPTQLAVLNATMATAIGIGEASAVGKRATFKKEAVENAT